MNYIYLSINTLSYDERSGIATIIENMIKNRSMELARMIANLDDKEEDEGYYNIKFKSEYQLRELRDARRALLNYVEQSTPSE